MKLTKLLLTTIVLFSQYIVFSQSGKITLKTQIQLEDANCSDDGILRIIDIQMFYNNSFNSVKKIETKKCTELFSFQKYKGQFKAIITADKYTPSEINFEITDAPSDTLYLKATLYKKDKAKALNEVVVSGNSASPIKNEGNKTTFSVKNNDALSSGTALETIQRLPGVMNDVNGNITLKGKSVTVFVDGLPTNMSGQDLTNYLNSISASTVAKVEIINNPGAAFDANTAADVINVVTTQKNKRGINGTLFSGITMYRKSKYQNSLNLNGLYHKVNWNLNLGYSDINYEVGSTRIINEKTIDNNINNNSLSDFFYKPFNIKAGFGFPINSNNSIDVRYSFSKINENALGTSNYLGNNNNIITQQSSNSIQENSNVRNEITTGFYNFNRDLNIDNNSSLGNSNYQNTTNNAFTSKVNKLKGDLIIPLTLFKVSSGFKIGNSNITSNGSYTNSLSNNATTIPFEYKDLTTALYIEIFKKYSNFDFTAGIRHELINIESKINPIDKTEQKYSNLFPSFNIGYHMGNLADLNLSYSKKVSLPGYQELDPNTSGISNNLVTDGGNPFLKPSFSNNLELKLNFLKAGFLSFTYTEANNENYFIITKENNAIKQTYAQFNNIKNYGASLGVPIPLGIITKGLGYLSTIKDFGEINYIYFYTGINAPRYNKEGYTNDYKSQYYLGANSQFILPFGTKMSLNYFFFSKGQYQIYNVEKSLYKLDLFLSKTIFKKSTKLVFTFSDIFNSANGISGSLINSDFKVSQQTYSDSQRVKFSITYNFGSYKSDKPSIKEDVDERENKKSSMEMKL
jgi:iron complex outermembrane recepter protein